MDRKSKTKAFDQFTTSFLNILHYKKKILLALNFWTVV